MREIRLRTEGRTQLVEITRQVEEALDGARRLGGARLRPAHDRGLDDQRARRSRRRARPRGGARADRRRRVVAGSTWRIRTRPNAPSHMRAALAGPAGRRARRRRPTRPRHLAGDLLLRVRRSPRPHGLRDGAALIEVEGLSKRFGKTQSPSPASASASSRGRSRAFSGRTARGNRRRCARCSGSCIPTRAARRCSAFRTASSSARSTASARCSRPARCTPGARAGTTCACSPRPRALPPSRVDEVLTLVELSAAAKRRVKGYSLGMRQRLGLACALLGDPEVLVLDEPANGLDPAGIRWLRDFLRSLAGEGRTILLSSHVLARGRADRRPRRDHPSRQARAAGADRARCSRGARGATRVRSPTREAPDGAPRRAGRRGHDARRTARSRSSWSPSASASSPRRTGSSCTS